MANQVSVSNSEISRFLRFGKGIAILSVWLHHAARSAWIENGCAPPAFSQWAFTDPQQVFGSLADAFYRHAWAELLLRLFAKFSYFGPHIFVFLSGLGLAYGHHQSSFASFLKNRLLRIMVPFWISILIFSLWKALGSHPYSLLTIIRRLTLYSTIFPGEFFSINSPTWSLVVFLQLYLLFPISYAWLKAKPRLAWIVAITLALVSRWLFAQPHFLAQNIHWGLAIGLTWWPLFLFGIHLGHILKQNQPLSYSTTRLGITAIVALPLLIGCLCSQTLYILHDLAIGALVISLLFLGWHWTKNRSVARALSILGSISFPLLLYHRPILSKALYHYYQSSTLQSIPIIAYIIIQLACIVFAIYVLGILTNRLHPRIKSLFGYEKTR